MSGDDSAADGAIKGALIANVLKVVLPLAATYAIGWATVRGVEALIGRVGGGSDAR